MIQKDIVENILENIENSLYSKNWKFNTLRTIKNYKKKLLIETNPKIKKLVEESKKYNENSIRYRRIAKKIDNEVQKINNT